MQPVKQTLPIQSFADLMSAPVFKIFTAYENPDAFARARKIHDQLDRLCGGEVEILSVSLSFALFDREQSRKRAIAEAATADVIIISARGACELPAPVREWTKTWPCRKQAGQDALVTVFDSGSEPCEEQKRLASFFRNLAQDRGLEFFLQSR